MNSILFPTNFIEVLNCSEFPSHINSNGIWVNTDDPAWWLNNSLPLLQSQIVLLFCLTQAIYFILKHFGIPKLPSQLIIGIIFGCSWKEWDAIKFRLFPFNSQEVIGTMAMFGYTVFLFLTGVKMNMSLIFKTGTKAMTIGVLALMVPIVSGTVASFVVRKGLTQTHQEELPTTIATYSITYFPVISSLLGELKLINSELGRLCLSSGLVSDSLSLFLLIISTLSRTWKVKHGEAFMNLFVMIGYFLVLLFVVRPAMFWIIQQTPEGKPVKNVYIYGIILLVLLSSVLSTLFGQYAIFGPYILGLIIPDGPPLGSTLVAKFECFVTDIFLPVFVTTCAMRVDLTKTVASFGTSYLNSHMILVSVTFVVKLITCVIPSMYCKMPFTDSLALAFIMGSKGIVDLAAYTLLRDNHILSDEVHGFAILWILFNSTFVPVTVRFLYDPSRKYAGYQRRNIMHLKPDSELRVLACINRKDNIFAVISLLKASCPRSESPIAVYVLHLIELIGRASPVFISHQMQKKTLNSVSYSEDVIISFNKFERDNRDDVYIECFTAISPHKLMHEDICTLALDKLTSLIILPFHQTWSADGTVEQDDNSVRSLNCSVLKRAPCSVAIFADRGCLGHSATTMLSSGSHTYSVCVIFLGGKDDREALSYAKRMAKDSRVNLTIVQLVSLNETGLTNWDKMLDSLALKDVEFNEMGEGCVTYIEEVVNDGSQTTVILKSMVDDYDLMIVGRRHGMESPQTMGFSEWNENPELGIIGDLLVSADIQSNASVLVMQQQQITD